MSDTTAEVYEARQHVIARDHELRQLQIEKDAVSNRIADLRQYAEKTGENVVKYRRLAAVERSNALAIIDRAREECREVEKKALSELKKVDLYDDDEKEILNKSLQMAKTELAHLDQAEKGLMLTNVVK